MKSKNMALVFALAVVLLFAFLVFYRGSSVGFAVSEPREAYLETQSFAFYLVLFFGVIGFAFVIWYFQRVFRMEERKK